MSCKHEDGCMDCLREEVQRLREEKEYLQGVVDHTLQGLQTAQNVSRAPKAAPTPPRPPETLSARSQAIVVATKPVGGKPVFHRNPLPKPTSSELMTVPEMMKVFKISRSAAYTGIKKGQLPCRKNSDGQLMVTLADAEAFRKSRGPSRKRGVTRLHAVPRNHAA